jgi:tetratricopeptide (TPR) repeat protein
VITGRADFVGQYAHSSLRPVANYVPRPTLQQKIREQLPAIADPDNDESRTVVVWGLGGSGKSQLVLNYIREYRREYGAVFWVEAGQKDTIERDYIQIYRFLYPEVARSSGSSITLEDALPSIKRWFQRQKERCLFVIDSADSIDNVEDPSYVDLNYYFPDAPRVDMIITTRSSQAHTTSPSGAVEVGKMAAAEAVELFRKCAKPLETSQDIEGEILTIVKELGYLALAIMLAGSYVGATPRLSSNVRLYLPEYHEHRKRLLSRKAIPNVHRYGESVLSTWETSFAAVERQSRVASRLLCLLAFMNFDDIFPGLFDRESRSKGVTNNSRRIPGLRWLALLSWGTIVDQYAIESGFATLQIYSLVSWQADQGAYTMHKLVHAWAHDRLEVKRRQTWSLAALELLCAAVEKYYGILPIWTRLVSHVMANITAMSKACGTLSYSLPHRDRDLVATVGNFLRRLGRWAPELDVRVFEVRVSEEILGKEHPLTLTSMGNLAAVRVRQGNFEQAEEMFRQTLELPERVLELEHPNRLACMSNLAGVLRNQGKVDQAEEIQRRTLELCERVLGKEHPDTLTNMNKLALVLNDQCKHKQAEEIHRQTLELGERVLGKEHPNTLCSVNNLAVMLGKQGEYEQAETMFRRTLELMETLRGEEHPDTLMIMNNLAQLLNCQGKYKQAEEMHRKVLKLSETVLGKAHPDTLMSMNNLAFTMQDQARTHGGYQTHGGVCATMKPDANAEGEFDGPRPCGSP